MKAVLIGILPFFSLPPFCLFCYHCSLSLYFAKYSCNFRSSVLFCFASLPLFLQFIGWVFVHVSETQFVWANYQLCTHVLLYVLVSFLGFIFSYSWQVAGTWDPPENLARVPGRRNTRNRHRYLDIQGRHAHHARMWSSCAWTTNGEVHGETVTHNNVKRCLHKWILISVTIEAAMLEKTWHHMKMIFSDVRESKLHKILELTTCTIHLTYIRLCSVNKKCCL